MGDLILATGIVAFLLSALFEVTQGDYEGRTWNSTLEIWLLSGLAVWIVGVCLLLSLDAFGALG